MTGWTHIGFTTGGEPTDSGPTDSELLRTSFDRTIGFELTYVNPEAIEELVQWAAHEEARRREAAITEAFNVGVGLRIDVYDWRTEYWLDASVPVGTIEEHSHAGE